MTESAATTDSSPQSPTPKQNGGESTEEKHRLVGTTSSKTKKKSERSKSSYLSAFVATVFHTTLHAFLFLIFFILACVYVIRICHDDYFVTIVRRAERNDYKLQDELTYYNRMCNAVDLTATRKDASELYIDTGKSLHKISQTATSAVDKIMKHGAVMISDMLTPETITSLRQYVIQKNVQVKGTAAQFPMSQGYQRISFGIEAAEDPSVVTALKEIHDHPLFGNIIQELLGDENPALSEITAITASFGARDQTWHPDVKPDGNGLMYGRTYSHSYSLFIPLQNTTRFQGPTDLCPGTHYCADDDLSDLCEVYKIGLHEIRPKEDSRQESWKSGDGVLLNQQVWHRGAGHEEENMEERVVFIVSFLARPTDPRQLSRGTYFHQKWLNWGATWKDMADSAISMARPWNILRCLHLWKPNDRDWGYDLMTASALRIANNQKGCEPEELEIFVTQVMRGLMLPEFLDGTIDEEDDYAWQVYFKETIAKYFGFFQAVNIVGHAAFVVVLLVLAVCLHFCNRQSFTTTFSKGVSRLVMTHGAVAALAFLVLHRIHSSKWATDIASGKTLMRPFPDPANTWRRESEEMVAGGITTLPRRFDVLVGSRLTTKSIGAYARWLDYHPGNTVFDEFVEMYGGKVFRKMWRGESFPRSASSAMVESGRGFMWKHYDGRFLHQDYRTGDWREMNKQESNAYIQMRLFVGSRAGLLGTLKQDIDYMFDDYRFGLARENLSMSWYSQLNLVQLARQIFTAWPGRVKERPNDSAKQDGNKRVNDTMARRFFLRFRIPEPPKHYSASTLDKEGIRDFLMGRSYPSFHFGEEVEYIAKEENFQLFGATVTEISKYGGGYDLAFYGDHVKKTKTIKHNVDRKLIITRGPLAEGSRVMGKVDNKWYPGTIAYVAPDGTADVHFDDDDYQENLQMWEYYFQ